ncbi:MAG: threonine/serine dehydratase [Rhodospirillaceae bacterium]|jgi:threonine dehydratase|nr:threonine/serine dehydratase [Rhodospirillales bacterium]MBT3907379.1 threonine/serine dehydratase [Rhodospirillaceae bacterium]MBT4701684.1 threonine/serine dehydratase [Rhodospirillaceae bacterium]MBT5035047.1 threonine/serine dehydratase [Rhodospirillaceae bacterium]MBT6221824.1 threonine/serine dehydratase [Rhodospirillaceae bacterium]
MTPTFSDIEDAARVLKYLTVRTPLLESPFLNDLAGCRLLIKPEMLQKTGSFKFRGAYNTVSRIPEDRRANGVVAYSSGNHAQGTAAAAQSLNIPAIIVMPADAPKLKIANTKAYGAEVVLYDRDNEVREDIAEAIAKDRNATIIKPYDDRYVVAGQGTVGAEIAEDCNALGIELDALVVPCGGGGLTAGCALAFHSLLPKTLVYTAEPEGFDDTARSLVSGQHETNPPGTKSICDALLSPTPGEMTFEINRDLVSAGLIASDDDVQRTMAALFLRLKIVCEPGGAIAAAAVLSGDKERFMGKVVAVVCSGGNVDSAVFKTALSTSND